MHPGLLPAGFSLLLCGVTFGAHTELWGRHGESWDPGGRLPDFSFAGYHRGDTPLPQLPRGLSAEDFGAVGDDETDDTAAFRRAIELCEGGVIEIPAGRYVITDILEIGKSGVVFRGAGRERTVLFFPRPLESIRPSMGATTDGRPTSNYSWSGGFLWFRGSFGSRVLSAVVAPARRGDRTVVVGSAAGLREGQEVELYQRDTADNTLARHLYSEDPGNTTQLLGRTQVSLVARIVSLDGDRVHLDRALRFDVRAEWQPQLREFAPTVSECGVEDLSFEFPVTPYEGHFTEQGFNPVALSSVAHCWVRRVRILNADSGPMVSGMFNTLEDLIYESSRPPDAGGHVGHHGTYVGGADNLFTRFDLRCKFIHDLTVSRCIGNVFSAGRGVDLCLDHHKHTPVENLFTDLEVGAGTRLWRCGGGANLGRHCAARGTFWNLRADRPQSWPPVGFGPDSMNLVGLTTDRPAQLEMGGKWFEPIPPSRLEPSNLHAAQLERRLGLEALEAQNDLSRSVELRIGEAAEVRLGDGAWASLKLLGLEAETDSLRGAVREARAQVELNGVSLVLTSAMYRLPVTAGGVQIDCPVTRAWLVHSNPENPWGLGKDARFRLWPRGSPWVTPGTLGYPVRQRWFASDTQMANEPTFVDGGERPGTPRIYYHYGLDFGGAEGDVDVLSATDGRVVSAAGDTLAAFAQSPAKPRYDVIYVCDARGWFYRYSHLARIDVRAGDEVRMGQVLGAMGKEGGSGGWSHLHFDITRRQPSGLWGTDDAYAYVWQAYLQEAQPPLLAVARPHQLARVGETVRWDGSRSWSASGPIASYRWTFSDGTHAEGAQVHQRYDRPGTFSEVLEVADAAGNAATDFAVVQVIDPADTNLPPTIHAACFPTTGVRVGDEVTFKVRTFRGGGEGEIWDFGDGTPAVSVRSDGNARVHDPNGYAAVSHRFARPGSYRATVSHSSALGVPALGRVEVRVGPAFAPATRISIEGARWLINRQPLFPGTPLEGLLPNVRMVNATFEDRRRLDFNARTNTAQFLRVLPEYVARGVRAFTFNLQGGMPGYEAALNSAFAPDGRLREASMERMRQVIEACDRAGAAVILGCFYQRQDEVLRDESAVRRGVAEAARWIRRCGFQNVVLEIANEFDHGGFDHLVLRTTAGQAELMETARREAPGLLVSTSGLGHGRFPADLAAAADFLLIHFNGTSVEDIPGRIGALRGYGKPVVCNEDDKVGADAVAALRASTRAGGSYGLMLKAVNQYQPFSFEGPSDDPLFYEALAAMTASSHVSGGGE